ncbi:MAG: type IV pilus biogenesis protein PilM [Verrucomicrobiota bacterium]
MLAKAKSNNSPELMLLKSRPASTRNRKAITAIDIDGSILRVVTASLSGKTPKITRIASTPIEWPTEKKGTAAADGAAIKKALANLGIKPKEAALAVPRGQVVLRPLQVPMASDLQELAAIVNFQIAKDLPFRLDEATVDFKVLRVVELPKVAEPSETNTESGAGKSLEILVGAVKTEVVNYYRDLAQAAGFKLAALGLRSAVQARCLEVSSADSSGKDILLVSARQDEISIEIIRGGKLLFSRVAAVPEFASGGQNQGGNSGTNSEEQSRQKLLDTLSVEVVRSLHGYEGTPGSMPIQKLLVNGSTGMENEILQLLAAKLGLPGGIFDPASGLKLPKKDSAESAAASAAIGLAIGFLEPAGLSIDFANPKKPPVEGHAKRKQALFAVAALLAVLISVFGFRAHLIRKRMKVKEAVQQELTAAEKKLPVYKRLMTQTKSVQSWLADDQDWLDHLAFLSAILPPADQVYVSAINTTPQHVIRLSVQSKSGELLAELDKKLRAAGYEVKPLSITPANDKYGYNFRTTVELAVPKKMKPDLKNAKPPARPTDDSPPKTAFKTQASEVRLS